MAAKVNADVKLPPPDL